MQKEILQYTQWERKPKEFRGKLGCRLKHLTKMNNLPASFDSLYPNESDQTEWTGPRKTISKQEPTEHAFAGKHYNITEPIILFLAQILYKLLWIPRSH